jgi:hypothetical protein
MKMNGWIALLLFLTAGFTANGQVDPSKVCRVENGKLVITISTAWTKAQKLEVARLFELDTVLVLSDYTGKKEITSGGIKWEVVQLGGTKVELSKPMGKSSVPSASQNGIILDDRLMNADGLNKRESARYGINKFTRHEAFKYHDGIAQFYLPQQLQAREVYLSGSFNNWSTRQVPMQKTDSGWVVSLKLSPGQYLYKYIADGRWMQDPSNKLRENDGVGGYNSKVFCYNYRFFLADHSKASKVVVSGSFNWWNKKELAMIRIPSGWALYLYIHEGTHAYKFIVDGDWIPDPANKVVRQDGNGHENSFMSIGDTLWFRLKGYPDAKSIYVAGDFNSWNPVELPMNKTASGWELPYVLAAGNYEYKFVADGNWITDPENRHFVVNGGNTNSLLVVKPNHTFVLNNFQEAKKVIVTGNFTGWSEQNYQMVKENNRWQISLFLKPGKYSYKFLMDGEWITDPANDQWENNDFGSKNSVLWIEPFK